MEPYELRRGAFKNLTLRLGPRGELRVSAPWFIPRGAIDRFVAERSEWVAERRQRLPRLDSVSVWGTVCPVRVESPGRLPRVVYDPQEALVILRVPATWGPDHHRRILEAWERSRVTEALAALVPAWAGRMGLTVDRWTVKRLRSRWGSCQPATRSLVFNAALAAFPLACLEYVVVHELVHLIEPSHNARFHALVESWLPDSKAIKALLKKGSGPAGPGGVPGFPATPGGGTEP